MPNDAEAKAGERLSRRLTFWRGLLLVLAGWAWGVGTAEAETLAGAPPANLTIDGDPSEWPERAGVLTLLPTSPAARGGRVWVAEAADGLIIGGRVTGPAPEFAKTPSDMAVGDHVELWVALIDEVPLPKVGWGNQFGPVELDSPDSCKTLEELSDDANAIADCRSWYGEQQTYRRQFRKLFVRQWQLAPGVAAETYAQPAFAQLPKEARDLLTPLAPPAGPGQLPTARFAPVADGGYGFEIALPWTAFPPSATLDLSRLRLMVDVFSPGTGSGSYGPFATTAADRKYGDVSTFNLIRLDPLKHWRIARCSYPLTADDQWGERQLPAYFMPRGSDEVNEIFVIENYATGYQYTPEGFSPVVTATKFFNQEITPEVTVCGPPFAVRRGSATSFVGDLTLAAGGRVKPVPGGWLIARGPYVGMVNRFGSGACGACPLIGLQVLFLPAGEGPPTVAFSDAWLIEDEDVHDGAGRNARVTLSDDLMTITAWEGDAPDDQPKLIWTRSRKCYDAATHLFADCGREENVKPPADIPLPPDEPSP